MGPAVGVAIASSGAGCTSLGEQTNQYCYVEETCQLYHLEVECNTQGPGPYDCWCYQDSQFVGSCTEVDASCSTDGCCEFLFKFPG